MDYTIQHQTWHSMQRFIIAETELKASVQLELYNEPTEDGCTACICMLWVDESSRRMHFATELLDVAEKVAREHGHKAVRLWWNESDTPREVLQWYMKRGYNDIAFDGRGTYVLLEKKLV